MDNLTCKLTAQHSGISSLGN